VRRSRTRTTPVQAAAGLAAKFDEMTLNFVSRMHEAEAEAVVAVNALIGSKGSQDHAAISDLFEKVLHAGMLDAIDKLPPWPIDRCEFDELPVLLDGADSSDWVGLRRKQFRSSWIIISANANGTAGFFRPKMADGQLPLH
jgi:hypothetical protein